MHTNNNIILLSLLGIFLCGICDALPNITRLGAFNHQADESSPLFWHGRLVIMETLPNYNPQHETFCPTDYFTVRDLETWEIISVIESSCNHAFGTALVTTNETTGVETMWVFGTRWVRDNMDKEEREKEKGEKGGEKGRVGWDGPCSLGECGLDVFWSTDLKTWNNASAVDFPKGMTVYNTDVTYVVNSPPSLPKHNWVLILEESYPTYGYRNLFYIKNATSLNEGEWIPLNISEYYIPNFNTGGNEVGACPSIRFIPETGYYYVTTGGNNIYIVRSKDLQTWELGHYNGGTVLKPNSTDCFFMSPKLTAWKPDNTTVALMKQCLSWDSNVSDSDLTEIVDEKGNIYTIFLYQPNNQGGTGFSSLLIYDGNFQSFFESYFD